MLEVKNVSKVYGKKANAFQALDDVSFTVPDATTLAIVGKSGSGKSTLMHVMSGLDRPSSGEVVFKGKNVTKMKAKAADRFRASEMSFIFQAFFIEANRSCLDNVLLPLEIAEARSNRRVKLAEEALKAVDLFDKKQARARNLSGGQKQRLAVARAIVNKPKLLFADEPTGNLDSQTGDKIIQLLFDLNKKLGSTLVIVTHDKDLAERCAYRLHLKDGKVEKFEKPGREGKKR